MGKEWDSFGGKGNKKAEDDRAAARREDGKGNQPFGYSGSGYPEKGQRQAFVKFLTEVMAECLRVAKPGAYALVWALPRTSHWTATAIEDAGWVIQDRVSHLFASGFPKHKSKLKPACEDWWLAWKPAKKATELQIDACRISTDGPSPSVERRKHKAPGVSVGTSGWVSCARPPSYNEQKPGELLGRYPAHLVFSHHEGCTDDRCHADCAVRELDRQSGPDSGASRFFYCAKASQFDRGGKANKHPTVKNTDLMEWLVKLVTPPGGTVLDCFAGSGSTLIAARNLGYPAIGIEREAEYVEIIRERLLVGKRPMVNVTTAAGERKRVKLTGTVADRLAKLKGKE